MANSIKQMIKSGVIRRSDSGMFISLADIHVREGFNKREDDERTRHADDELFTYLMNGGSVPPLEVIARDEGYTHRPGFKYWQSPHPQEQLVFKMACFAFEVIRGSDVMDAIADLEDEE